MKPERLNGSTAMNEEGDIVPIDDVSELGPDNRFLVAGIDYSQRRKGYPLYPAELEPTMPEAWSIGESWQPPRSIEQHQQAIRQRDLARQAFYDAHIDNILTPYQELGGGLQAYGELEQAPIEEPFDTILRQYQPWQRDIRQAVESLGVLDMTPDMVDSMNKPDRLAYARHFAGYMDRLSTHHRLIGAADGEVEHYDLLEKTYGTTPEPAELIEYMFTLESLKLALLQTGVPQKLATMTQQENMSSYDRARQLKRDKQRHGALQIRFKTMKDSSTKPYVHREK